MVELPKYRLSILFSRVWSSVVTDISAVSEWNAALHGLWNDPWIVAGKVSFTKIRCCWKECQVVTLATFVGRDGMLAIPYKSKWVAVLSLYTFSMIWSWKSLAWLRKRYSHRHSQDVSSLSQHRGQSWMLTVLPFCAFCMITCFILLLFA